MSVRLGEKAVGLLLECGHGVRSGTVRWIGPAGAAKAEGPAFRVLADPDDRELRVRGAPYPLLPGMTGRAERRDRARRGLGVGGTPCGAVVPDSCGARGRWSWAGYGSPGDGWACGFRSVLVVS